MEIYVVLCYECHNRRKYVLGLYQQEQNKFYQCSTTHGFPVFRLVFEDPAYTNAVDDRLMGGLTHAWLVLLSFITILNLPEHSKFFRTF